MAKPGVRALRGQKAPSGGRRAGLPRKPTAEAIPRGTARCWGARA
jgi:hypothetical protein